MEDDGKCKKDGEEKEGGSTSDTKDVKDTKLPVKTKSEGESSPDHEVPQAGSAKSDGELELGVKKEKDMMMIVEELRTLRDHQADLINQLMAELSYTEKENSALKNQVCKIYVHIIALYFVHDYCSDDWNIIHLNFQYSREKHEIAFSHVKIKK